MKLLELFEALRAMQVHHGDVHVVLGIMDDGQMRVDNIGMIGTVKNEEGDLAICLAIDRLPEVELEVVNQCN